MVEVVLLQIPPSNRKALWVCMANNCDGVMYAEHVLLHSFVLLLLNLIQCPYHGIVVTLVTKPFTRVPMETGKNMRAHVCLIILLKEGIHIKLPECVRHFCPQISRLEDRHIQSCRSQPLLLPPPSLAPASMLMDCGLACSGVPIRVWCFPVW